MDNLRMSVKNRAPYRNLLIILSITLLLLPFITTFNEFLTKMVEASRAYRLIQAYIVPFQVRMVSVILTLFGLNPQVTNDSIVLEKNASPLFVYLSWNCLGWQSFVLLTLSLITGLQGSYRWSAKITCVVLGVVGTFWTNLVRITLVALVAFVLGQVPAIIFHDYFSTLFIIAWLLLFWKVSFNHILE